MFSETEAVMGKIILKEQETMLKIRMSGTAREIKWFKKILVRDRRIQLLGLSELLPNEKSPKYHRMYAEIRKNLPPEK